jgi:glutathione peroxidase
MRTGLELGLCAVLLGCFALMAVAEPPKEKAAETKASSKEGEMTLEKAISPLDFTMKDIDGKDVALSKYKGNVVLIVNVASKCGYTPQYKELEAIYQKYKDRGFVVLGFPANDFGAQEPGTNAEIKQFCSENFHVTFPMFAKISVKGADAADLYKFLTSAAKVGAEKGGDIKWNFTKFLLGRDGKVIARFESKVKPDDAAVTAEIEKALAAKTEPKPQK